MVPATIFFWGGNAVRGRIVLTVIKNYQDSEHFQHYLHNTTQLHCTKFGWNHN